jgi:hypothetical protein
MTENEYQLARLCEIAFIAGNLVAEKKIEFNDMDLEGTYQNVYVPILNEWTDGIINNIFKNKEEVGYISAYAQRRMIELYSVQ